MRPTIGNSRSAAKPDHVSGRNGGVVDHDTGCFSTALTACAAASSSEAAATFARAIASSRSARRPLTISQDVS